jgi:hypothetical protein
MLLFGAGIPIRKKSCKGCGVLFVDMSNGNRRKYHDRLCRGRVETKKYHSAHSLLPLREVTCGFCEYPFLTKKKNKRFCTARCKDASRSPKQRVECPTCHIRFLQVRSNHKVCTQKCRIRLTRSSSCATVVKASVSDT